MAKYETAKEIKIPAIKDGTVIDHIPSRQTFKIIRIIDPQEFEHAISLALNLDSKKLGKKGVIKISNRTLTEEEVSKIGILAPNATVSIIKNYQVKKKIVVKLPDVIEKIVKCSNPNCITNIEDVKTRFTFLCDQTKHASKKMMVSNTPIKLRCDYCERTITREEIKLN